MANPVANLRTQAHNETIAILFCASPSYFQHVSVAAVSAVENTAECSVSIHVITCDVDSIAEEKLRRSLAQYRTAHLQIHHLLDGRLDHLFVGKHVTKETYLRLFAAEILSDEVTRIIYLD